MNNQKQYTCSHCGKSWFVDIPAMIDLLCRQEESLNDISQWLNIAGLTAKANFYGGISNLLNGDSFNKGNDNSVSSQVTNITLLKNELSSIEKEIAVIKKCPNCFLYCDTIHSDVLAEISKIRDEERAQEEERVRLEKIQEKTKKKIDDENSSVGWKIIGGVAIALILLCMSMGSNNESPKSKAQELQVSRLVYLKSDRQRTINEIADAPTWYKHYGDKSVADKRMNGLKNDLAAFEKEIAEIEASK